jgi:ORF6N domain
LEIAINYKATFLRKCPHESDECFVIADARHVAWRCSIPSYSRQTAKAAVAKALVPTEDIARAILVLRGHRVLLDTELSALYGVSTKRFNEQVRRNRKRFPEDFMFQLNAREAAV